MKKINILSTLFISLTCFAFAFAQTQDKIISQPDSPVKILSYEAQYQAGNSYSQEGVYHKVKYQNMTNRKIVAVQIGLVSFDIWNNYLDSLCGDHIEELDPNDTKEETWISTVNGGYSFCTGISYISKVRFENGEIWSADLDKVTQQMEEIEKGFNLKLYRKSN